LLLENSCYRRIWDGDLEGREGREKTKVLYFGRTLYDQSESPRWQLVLFSYCHALENNVNSY
jgi:hypothetical protein